MFLHPIRSTYLESGRVIYSCLAITNHVIKCKISIILRQVFFLHISVSTHSNIAAAVETDLYITVPLSITYSNTLQARAIFLSPEPMKLITFYSILIDVSNAS